MSARPRTVRGRSCAKPGRHASLARAGRWRDAGPSSPSPPARARPIGTPMWSYEGYRIAYLSGPSLRIVNGDGTGDRLVARRVAVSPVPALAWRPATHQLAYVNARGQLVLLDADRNVVLWRRHVP